MLEVCCPDPRERASARAWLTASAAGWRDIAMVARDGSAITVAWASADLSDDLRVGVGIDVRERKAMEIALRDSEERLRQHLAEIEGVYANAPVGLCVLDRDLRFRRVNARLAEMNGIPAAAHIGRTLHEVAPELAAEMQPFAVRLLERGEPVLDVEIHAETAAKPGERRTWLESWLPIKNAAGEVTGINVVARELTEQRLAEKRLAESEARFRTMAETVPDILFTADPYGHASYVNQRYYRITGMPPGSALGMSWLEALHPDDRDGVVAAWADNTAHPKGFSMRYRLCDRSGCYRWFETRARPIFDKRGKLAKWFGAASDVDELVRAREALEEADRQKNEFLAILGHELRNPMAPVRSAVDVMEAIDPEDSKLRWAIGVVDRQSRHMSRLLDDLLDVSRIIRGKLKLDKRLVRLEEIIEDAVDGARHLIEQRGHNLEIALPDTPVFLQVDVSRLAQVLVNLLTNAAKYTHEGGEIRLRAEARTGVVVIRVIDNGQGISEELRAGLFDAFTQGRRELNRSPGGLGLGLAIASRLTELHGGRIEMHSAGADAGAEFSLFLPRAEPPAETTAVPGPRAEAPREAVKVLVVDDNEDVARSMGVLLMLLGCEVQTRFSGAEAIDAAREFQPRLVLLDIGMDGMDGFETARRLRAAEPDPERMLLVAVTGYGDPGFRSMGRKAGFDQHLTKPVGRERLTALLDAVS
jgi:PAS domain S-box-containing protein